MCLVKSDFFYEVFTNGWDGFVWRKRWFIWCVICVYISCKSIITLDQKQVCFAFWITHSHKHGHKCQIGRTVDSFLSRKRMEREAALLAEILYTNDYGFVFLRFSSYTYTVYRIRLYTIRILLLFTHLIILSLFKHVNAFKLTKYTKRCFSTLAENYYPFSHIHTQTHDITYESH